MKDNWLTTIAVTALGIILATIPLLLWIAWSPYMFTLVLIVGAVSAALLIALLDRRRPGD